MPEFILPEYGLKEENNDIYYGARFPGRNYNRALNQATLLDALIKKEDTFKRFSLLHKF